MAYRLERGVLFLCLSALIVLDPSADVKAKESPDFWQAPRDAKWKGEVDGLKKFLSQDAWDSYTRARTLEENDGQRQRDLQGPSSSLPELNVLVVLLQWSNHADRSAAVPRESFDKLFNGEGRDADLYPGGSVKEYFKAMSYGDFTINFEVTDWIMTDFTEQQVTADGSQGRTQELQDAFVPALEFLDDDFTQFRNFDKDFDRKLDLTVFLHSGYDGSEGGNDCETGATQLQRVASHARTGADNIDWVARTGHRLGAYAVAPAFRGVCDLEIGRIGTIVHELIHPFGIPDLYDTGPDYGTGNIGGIDRFGVMANQGGNSGGDLSFPGHISAWTRKELGWIEPTVIDTDGTYQLRPVSKHPDMYIINKGFEEKEYLLLENRQPIAGDFDEKFMNPGGILIYHIDENVWDIFDNGGITGNFPRGGPFQDGWPGNGKHYPVALLQADGLYELEQGINGGTSADLWNQPSQVLGPGNGEKTASTANYPNTDSYANGVIKPTGITIKNFQTNGNIVTFQVCGLSGGDCPDNPDPIDPPVTTDPTGSPQVPEVPTKAPSQSPTATPFEALVNGSCEIAADAFRSDDLLKAISNITNGTISQTCYGEDRAGAWYTVDAGSVEAGEIIQANTCFSETKTANKISVYKGTNCTTLECVTTDEIACKNGQTGHVVYWEAEEGEDYYVFTHLAEDADANDDSILVDTQGDGSLLLNVVSFPPLENDDCASAITVPTDGSVISGLTEGARPEVNVTFNDTCGVESAGVWFKVDGTGANLRATTCLPGTDSPTQIHVFSGKSCDSLSCVSVESNNYAVCSDFNTGTNSATVNFETEDGMEYFILVGSRDGSVGKFELSVSEFEGVDNDQCANAVDLTVPQRTFMVQGSTQNATNDFPYGEYCGVPLDTAGVWYTIEGTGDGLSISTCGMNDYNSAISVFTGSECGELECLTGIATRDPSCDYNGVTAAWKSEANEIYHVYVHGSAQNSLGSFELEAEKFETTVENGFCNDAIEIVDPGVYIKASTLNATHSAPTNVCGQETIFPGLWYMFQGTGYPFYISGCPFDDIDVSVSLFEGDTCGELSCVSGKTFAKEQCVSVPTAANQTRFLEPDPNDYATLESELGKTYYLFVHGQAKDGADTTNLTNGVGGFDITFLSGAPQTAPPTMAPTVSNTTNSTGSEGDGTQGPDVVEKEKNKFNRKKLWWILLGVALLVIVVGLTPPCWIYRKKLCGCCFRKDEKGDSDDYDDEEGSFDDEQRSSYEESSAQESAPMSPASSGPKKYKWQTLSFLPQRQ